jgi:type II secretory pathway component PulF
VRIKYSAKDTGSKTVKGVVEAGSMKAAASLLREQKLIPISFVEMKPAFSISALNNISGKVTGNDLTNFTRQLSTMITAGLPLTDALNLLKVQSKPALAKVVGVVLADVQSGLALSSAMAKHPKVFSKVYVALVKAGESAGLMDKILNRLAETEERGREFKGKVIGAMIYPIIILVGMIGVVAIMVIVVIPQLSSLYKDFGSELPLATKVLLGISDFAVKGWWMMLVGLAGLVVGIRAFLITDYGRDSWGRGIFKIPVMGPLIRQTILAEFTRVLALLLSAGVSVVEALRISAASTGNVIMEKDVLRIANQVEKGFPVSISFTESENFPPIIGQMAAVGEETGKMDDVLEKISHYFETESEQKVKGLTTALEPIILIIMAVGIGFLMYAVVMPLYEITNKI